MTTMTTTTDTTSTAAIRGKNKNAMRTKKNDDSEFDDRNGFAVVDSFFQSHNLETNNEHSLDTGNVVRNSLNSNDKTNRSGVGLVNSKDTPSGITTSTNSTFLEHGKRILQIGDPNRRKRNHPEIDNHDNEINDDIVDDDEEELGRTAIVQDNISNVQEVKQKQQQELLEKMSLSQTKKKKKKSGKKERQNLLQQQHMEDSADAENSSSRTNDNASKAIVLQQNQQEKDVINNFENNKDTEINDIDNSNIDSKNPITSTKKVKRHRKKVRSKQKNIVKDHRDVKPIEKLQSNRQLRPMTATTRIKLQTPKIMKNDVLK